jgi:chromodomain-helicase-DNA-binding protein 7
MTDQQMSADFLSAPRRRRPRVDPTLLDWKKLTGEENVSVINRTTGKKVQLIISTLLFNISINK